MRTAILINVFILVGCNGEPAVSDANFKAPRFSLTVEEVFYIAPPVDRVIVVGTIGNGTVQSGDSLIVQSSGRDIAVVVEGIDTPSGEISMAEQGQQVGLRIQGIQKGQVVQGDTIVSVEASE